MTPQERKQIYNSIKLALQFLTDEELKALAAVAITRETADGTPLKNL